MGLNALYIALCLWVAYAHGRSTPGAVQATNREDKCRYTTGAGVIDLNPLTSDDNSPRFKDVPDQQGQFLYSWNPCGSFNELGCNGVEMCQMSTVNPSMDYVLGRAGDSIFVQKSGNLFLSYTEESDLGEVRQTFIKLECQTSLDDDLIFVDENPPLTYNLRLTSRYACPNSLTTSPIPPTTPTPAIATATSGPGPAPGPAPGPNIFSLETITVLLACILLSLCMLNCMLCMGLITRRSRGDKDNTKTGHDNQAFEKKKPLH